MNNGPVQPLNSLQFTTQNHKQKDCVMKSKHLSKIIFLLPLIPTLLNAYFVEWPPRPNFSGEESVPAPIEDSVPVKNDDLNETLLSAVVNEISFYPQGYPRPGWYKEVIVEAPTETEQTSQLI